MEKGQTHRHAHNGAGIRWDSATAAAAIQNLGIFLTSSTQGGISSSVQEMSVDEQCPSTMTRGKLQSLVFAHTNQLFM